MLDLSYFQNQNSNVQGFFNGGTWQTWIKPRGAKMVNIICQGSGAGGGGGYLNTTTRGGGGGGGTGATARLTINANLLPDILYILPGIGGAGGTGGTIAGGASGTAGTAGQNSFVTLIPSTVSVSNVVLRSGTTPATGGGAGSGAVGGTAGAAETISLIANNIFSNLGTFTFQAGVAATAASTTNAGTTTPSNFVTNSGGGGGTGTGGAVTAAGVFPGITAAPVNTNGANGPVYYKPILMLYGGRGGGGSTTGNGGNGGNGSPGTGGGGGGAGQGATGVAVGGNGGRGGDGFVIITTSL
jgi:hypothetical protein